MIGSLTPAEIAEIIEDDEVQQTDVPQWVELVIEEKCSMVLQRLQLYEEKYKDKYGTIPHTVQKLALYHHIWTNWDGKEPCQYDGPMPLSMFYDDTISVKNTAR